MIQIAADSYLIDSDILIDYLRGQPACVAYLESLTEPLAMSVITPAELYSNIREGHQRQQIEELSTVLELVDVTSEIAIRGGLHRRTYGKTHTVSLSDALIAATAEMHSAKLVTLNVKHFPMFPDLTPPCRKP